MKPKRRVRLRLAAFGFAIVAAAGILLYANSRQVGNVLDRYRGVPVYDNGLLFFQSHGRHYATDGYYYGQKWQCVEFVKRFYHQAYSHMMPDVWGHARDFFDEALPDGALNSRRAMVQFRNGSTNRPAPDDLVVFSDTKYGHVAVVSEVSSNELAVVQQNMFSGPRARYSLVESNGHYFVTAPRRPAGWLRVKR